MPEKPSPARLFSPALKGLSLLLGILGQALTFSRARLAPGAHFLYYTNLTNLLAIALMAALLAFDLRALKAGRPAAVPGWLQVPRFAITAGILLTFAGFSLLLLPRMEASYLLSADNLLVHNLVPLLAGLDYVLFAEPGPGKDIRAWQGLWAPALYAVLVLALSLMGVRFLEGAAAPYFFMDPAQNGWFSAGEGRLGVAWWLLIILALQLALSRLLLGLNKSARLRE